MKVVRRRTPDNSRPFTSDEGRGIGVLGLCFVYPLLALGAASLVPEPLKAALGRGGVLVLALCYFPFAYLFQVATHRLLRPLLRPKKAPTEIEESSAELAAWASSTLDKKRKP